MKKSDANNPLVIFEHESGVRKVIATSMGRKYQSYKSLDEAKSFQNSVAIFEGDYGGQIYLVAIVESINCSEEAMQKLLIEIDSLEWDDIEGASIYFEEGYIGKTIAGGMGGGEVVNGIWIHENLRKYEDPIKYVLCGQRTSIFTN